MDKDTETTGPTGVRLDRAPRAGLRAALVTASLLAGSTLVGACSSDDTGSEGGPDGSVPPSAGGMDGSGGGTAAGGKANGSSGGPSAGGAAGSPSNGDAVVGTFNLDFIAPTPTQTEGQMAFLGKVFDGPTPSTIVWEQTDEDGDCILLEPRVPFCETPCGGSAACVEDDVCQPYPEAHSVGAVTLSGVRTRDGKTEFTMNPINNNYQPTGGIQIPYDGVDEDSTVSLQAEGGDFAQFSMMAGGIEPLVLMNEEIRVDPDTAIDLVWNAASSPSEAQISVKLDISHHGGAKGLIECEGPDDGTLEIPASLVTGLLDLGFAGFPTILVTRRSTGSATIAPGRVELRINSQIERAVEIDGLVSCTDASECPMGQTCGVDLRCQ